MQAFIIFRGNTPLVWSTDEDTQVHTGVTECFFAFATQLIAHRVMAAVPSLFDLDEEDAEILTVRAIDLPN